MWHNSGQDFLSIEYYPISGKNKDKLTTLYYKGLKCDLIAWLSDVAIKKKNKIVKLEKVGTYWDGFPLNNLTKEGNVLFPKGKKPEALLQRILELITQKGDILYPIMDERNISLILLEKLGLISKFSNQRLSSIRKPNEPNDGVYLTEFGYLMLECLEKDVTKCN